MPQSDFLMAKVASINKKGAIKRIQMVFTNDPGRRNRSLVGARHLRNLLELVVISKDLMLMRLGTSYENSYWTMIDQQGRLVEMDSSLSATLHHDNGQRTVWTKVQSYISKAHTCQLLLCAYDNPYDEEAPHSR